jgi:F-type H+-transporting ATPase subunit gamma
LIIISSNKGLCGAFNANIAKRTQLLIREEYLDLYRQGNLDIIACGRKAAELLISAGYGIMETHHEIIDDVSYDQVKVLAKRAMNEFVTGKYDEIKIIYNQFKNAVVQELTVEQFLPIEKPEIEEDESENHLNFIFEPSKEQIVKELIPKSLKIQMFKAFLDSIASEHGARMTAMHAATDNATQLIKDLQLEYNKARQAAITKEILEIVGGANALKG